MKKRTLEEALLEPYRRSLQEAEKSRATIEKYHHAVQQFLSRYRGQTIRKALVLEYKSALGRRCAIPSANAALAAVNSFLRFWGLSDCCVRPFKTQKALYCPEERELTQKEYHRLVRAAQKSGHQRLALLLETLCSTGIRVSELSGITAEAAALGEARVTCKGKTRRVFLPGALREKLRGYLQSQGITTGPVFVTRTGRPLHRSHIWRLMKGLCEKAGVEKSKVYPHSLRHLFARCFYAMDHDVAKLADLLGHSSINTTRLYIITTGAEHRRQLEALHLVM